MDWWKTGGRAVSDSKEGVHGSAHKEDSAVESQVFVCNSIQSVTPLPEAYIFLHFHKFLTGLMKFFEEFAQ